MDLSWVKQQLDRGVLPEPGEGGSYAFTRPDGSVLLLDSVTLEFLLSEKPAPTQGSLDVLREQVRGARVQTLTYNVGSAPTRETLGETNDAADLDELFAAFRVRGGRGHCMCVGGPHVQLLGETGEELAFLSMHHGRSIRWSAWSSDGELVDGRASLEWLAAHGYPQALDDWEGPQEVGPLLPG